MLVLGRREGQRLRIVAPNGDIIWLSIVEIRKSQAKIGLDLQRDYQVSREEILPLREQYPLPEDQKLET